MKRTFLEYGEYAKLPCSLFSGIKLKIFKKIYKGDYPWLVNFLITWKCNLRCRMCNIWKKKEKTEISPEKVEKVFSERIFRKTKVVKLMGGEPTLHSKFLKIIEILSELLPNAQKVVSTNAYPYKRMKKVINESVEIDSDIIFSLSLDGIGKTHDFIRGVNGVFSEVMKTAKYLKKIERKTKKVKLRFSFTITPWNYKDIEKVIRLAKKMEAYIGIRLAHVSKHFYGNQEKLKLFGFNKKVLIDIHKILKIHGLNTFQKKITEAKLTKRKLPCLAFINSIAIDPQGRVKPCIYSKAIRVSSIEKFWNSERAKLIRKKIYSCKSCWSDCQTIPDLKGEYFYEKIEMLKMLLK